MNDKFEFPLELDMYPYTLEGIEESEGTSGAEGAAVPKPSSYYMYKLKGVVVHMGTTDSGHYYSIIRDDKESHTGDGGE